MLKTMTGIINHQIITKVKLLKSGSTTTDHILKKGLSRFIGLVNNEL